jgi:type IV pilus assembly protein PilM
MTRLHIQVNQTIQFYRGQQGGAAPQRLFLSGGAAIMPYTAQFFAEKLNLTEVEYFNPLRNVDLDASINREELAKCAHSFGEVVGLGLRNLAHCPVELNLMPKSILQRQRLNQKKPYFAAAIFCLILVVLAFGWFYQRVAGEKAKALETLEAKVTPLKRDEQTLSKITRDLKAAEADTQQYTEWLQDRFYWADLCTRLRQSLISVEEDKQKELNAPTGVWIEKLVPISSQSNSVAAAETTPKKGGRASRAARVSTDEINTVLLTCRGVNLNKVKPDANTVIAFALQEALKAQTNLFETNGVQLGTIAEGDPAGLTFTCDLSLKLKRPFKL